MPWFDAGVNLLDKRFDADEVIQRAKDAGVEKLCIITTHPSEWDAAVALYNKYPTQCCYTIGVHPHNAKDVTPSDYKRLRELAQQNGVLQLVNVVWILIAISHHSPFNWQCSKPS